MLFDDYSEDIPRLEIAEAARTHPNIRHIDELRRTAHFSELWKSEMDLEDTAAEEE